MYGATLRTIKDPNGGNLHSVLFSGQHTAGYGDSANGFAIHDLAPPSSTLIQTAPESMEENERSLFISARIAMEDGYWFVLENETSTYIRYRLQMNIHQKQ